MTEQYKDALVLKRDAAQATLDHFSTRKFRLGHADCIRMAVFHLRKLGYKVALPSTGSYATIRSAQRELAKRGYKTVADAMDGLHLERISPAAALAGDIIEMPAEHPLGALAVCVGNGRIVGWADDGGAAVLQPLEYAGVAWRAVPQ